MPEMIPYVDRRASACPSAIEKICWYYVRRARRDRLHPDTVLLEDLRCDGTAHGGCQARVPDLLEGGLARAASTHVPPDDPRRRVRGARGARRRRRRRQRASRRVVRRRPRRRSSGVRSTESLACVHAAPDARVGGSTSREFRSGNVGRSGTSPRRGPMNVAGVSPVGSGDIPTSCREVRRRRTASTARTLGLAAGELVEVRSLERDRTDARRRAPPPRARVLARR